VAPLVADQNIERRGAAETTLGACRGGAALQALRARLTSSVLRCGARR